MRFNPAYKVVKRKPPVPVTKIIIKQMCGWFGGTIEQAKAKEGCVNKCSKCPFFYVEGEAKVVMQKQVKVM